MENDVLAPVSDSISDTVKQTALDLRDAALGPDGRAALTEHRETTKQLEEVVASQNASDSPSIGQLRLREELRADIDEAARGVWSGAKSNITEQAKYQLDAAVDGAQAAVADGIDSVKYTARGLVGDEAIGHIANAAANNLLAQTHLANGDISGAASARFAEATHAAAGVGNAWINPVRLGLDAASERVENTKSELMDKVNSAGDFAAELRARESQIYPAAEANINDIAPPMATPSTNSPSSRIR